MPPATPAKTSVFHLEYLDSLRALAAIFVVMHHALLQYKKPGMAITGFPAVFAYGHYSVNLFIVLSGFCLMIPVIRNRYVLSSGAAGFFRKRARRILPTYFFALTFSLLLIGTLIGKKTGTHWDSSIPVTVKDLITHILLIQDIFTDTSSKINHSLWSISVEWRIYFLFPLLVALWRKRGAIPVIAITSLFSLLLIAVLRILHTHHPFVNIEPWGICPHYLLLFAIGMFGADVAFSRSGLLQRRMRRFVPWRTCCAVLSVLIIVVPRIHFRKTHEVPWEFTDVLVGLWALCIVIIASRKTSGGGRTPLLRRALSWKPLAFVGTFSYSLYLIHAPVLELLTSHLFYRFRLGFPFSFWSLCCIGTPIVIAAAFLFYTVCERPFITKRA
jgi:peptidoglycan/LPS O-acetylase OafA/YrhL